MHVCIVIDAPLPVKGYGGTERVAYWLGRELAFMGHKVTFLCQAQGPIHFAQVRDFKKGRRLTYHQRIEASIPGKCDILHFFSPPPSAPEQPYLLSIEGNGKAGELFLPNTVFVSRNHAERHGWSEFVYNGVPLNDYPFFPGPRRKQLLFLAKASWKVKNLKGAIAIAKSVGMPLRVCGGSKPWHQPLSAHAQYLGMVDGREKLRELGEAKALLFPVIWNEPFGIAVIEALAVGTPVLASPWGSLPEILSADCGRICHSHDDFIKALTDVESLDPLACRERVKNNFSSQIMATRYLELYEKILTQGRLRDGQPRTAASAQPEELLYYAECPGAPKRSESEASRS